MARACDHELCNTELGRSPTQAEVEQILGCLKERGIVEVVPGSEESPRYRRTKEYRDGN